MREDMALGVRPDSLPIVRALGMLYLVGPSVAAITLLLPHSDALVSAPIWIAIVSVYALAPIVFVLYRRMPPWAISATIAFTNTAISTGIYFNHEATSVFAWFYLWVTPYAAVFFSRAHAAGHVIYVGAAYGALLAVAAGDGHGAPGDAEPSQWMHTMGALIVTMLLVRALARALRENLESIEEERRRRALEINDDVVQRMIVARQAYAADDRAGGDVAFDAALERARHIMAELIAGEGVAPGALRRDAAASDASG